MIAGGSEALLVPGVLVAWQALRTLAPADAANPSASCKPFDKRRGGLVLGEGAAAFVLEEESRARARREDLRLAYGLRCNPATRCTCRGPIAMVRSRSDEGSAGRGAARAAGRRLHQRARHRDRGGRRGRGRGDQRGLRRVRARGARELDQVRRTAICSAARARSSSPPRCSRSIAASCRRPASGRARPGMRRAPCGAIPQRGRQPRAVMSNSSPSADPTWSGRRASLRTVAFSTIGTNPCMSGDPSHAESQQSPARPQGDPPPPRRAVCIPPRPLNWCSSPAAKAVLGWTDAGGGAPRSTSASSIRPSCANYYDEITVDPRYEPAAYPVRTGKHAGR